MIVTSLILIPYFKIKIINTNKCTECRGAGVKNSREEIAIKIPNGIENNEILRITGGGEFVRGGSPGDLYIKVHVLKDKHIRKEGVNLVMDLDVKLTDALLGADYKIETLEGPLTITIPEGIKIGEILRVKGRGVPIDNGKRGDLYVQTKIIMPHKLSKNARKSIEDLKSEGI